MNSQTRVRQLPAMELSFFCSQAAMILRSGIPLYEGMDVLRKSYEDSAYSAGIAVVQESVQAGEALYEGLEKAGGFPHYMVQMVRAGELTGRLDEVMEQLTGYYEKEARLRDEVRGAVAYPLVLVAMLAVVIGILVIKVLPIFASVFRGLGGGLDGAAGAVLSGGMLLGRVMLALVALLLLGVLAVFLLWRSGKQQTVLDTAGRLLPRIGRLRRQQAAQRFCSVVAMVLASGCSLADGAELLIELLRDGPGEAAALRFQQKLNETGDLGQAVQGVGLFEPLHEKMIGIGVSTGQSQIDQVLGQLAEVYAREVETGIQGLAASIEPTLVAILTVIIGGILLSVMLPLAGIMGSMI